DQQGRHGLGRCSGGVTGGLLVRLAALRGARVISTAGPSRAERVRALGASEVVDNDPGWPEQVRRLGVAAAVNAAPAGAASTIRAVGEGGRVATITSDPPQGERGIEVTSVIVRPDAYQLSKLVMRGSLPAARSFI